MELQAKRLAKTCASKREGGFPRPPVFAKAQARPCCHHRRQRRVQRLPTLTRGRAVNIDAGSIDWNDEKESLSEAKKSEGGVEKPPQNNTNTNSVGSTSTRSKYDKELTLSLLLPFGEGGLPPRGKTRHQKEEECDPWTQNCKTEAHVWESKCDRCFGTGQVVSGYRGHYNKRRARRHGSGAIRMMSTCVKCSGTGWVRHSSARTIPSPFPNGNPNSPNLAIARRSFQSQDFENDED